MTNATAPLTPAEADLRDFPFMPIMIHRLKRSRAWLLCKRRPELAFYLLNLWTEAWHSKPAGSLENDDMVLADAAMCGEGAFADLRADIMRGWIECADGRLYHPVVAEQVQVAWERKQAQRARTSAATAARIARQKERDGARHDQRNDDATFTKGQGQGQEERASSHGSEARSPEPAAGSRPKPAREPKGRKHPYPADAFATWYAKFPRKKARQDAERAFRKVEATDGTPFDKLLTGIDAFWRDNPDVTFWPYPASWLNGRRWEDTPTKAGPNASEAPDGQPKVDFGGGVRWPEATVRTTIARWRDDPSTWPEDRLGPPPNANGCRVPDHLLRVAA